MCNVLVTQIFFSKGLKYLFMNGLYKGYPFLHIEAACK